MRIVSSRANVFDGLFGTRLCFLLVLVFVCFVDRLIATSATATSNTTEKLSLHHPASLSPDELKTTASIKFNFQNSPRPTPSEVDAKRRELRRKLLELPKRRRSTASAAAHLTTAEVSSTATVVPTTSAADTSTRTSDQPPAKVTLTSTNVTTPPITTTRPTTATAATTPTTTIVITSIAQTTTDQNTIFYTTAHQPVPDPRFRKRKRQITEADNGECTEEDLLFLNNDPEFDEEGNLIISIFTNNSKCGDLFEDIMYLNQSRELEDLGPVKDIFRGLTTAVEKANYRVWLPIVIVMSLLLVIIIIAFCWKAASRKTKDEECKKIIPKLDSKPASSNGHAAGPRILDDNCGWMIPYDQFNHEQ